MKSLLIGLLFVTAGLAHAQTPDSVIILNENDFLQPNVNLNQPLFIVDGKNISSDSLSILNPRAIESIHVYKGLDAREKYGDDGKNGVVVIRLKEVVKREED